ncbi:MAG: hypothetical protein JWN23_1561 [Rhodocyclales bacterium]|nr:hypothetical protein [Rhodocyclales bacterium]
MKKIDELEGAELDYWVARACAAEQRGGAWLMDGMCGNEPFSSVLKSEFCPSSEWNYGGPIIERERISVCIAPISYAEWSAATFSLDAFYESGANSGQYNGRTMLIAAMRALVASKFGKEVEDIAE